MELYLDEVLFPRLINNIENFLKVLYEELKDSKIQRIEAEKQSTTKNVAYLEYKGIQVILNGRADLLIETDKARYIIDFKTGSYNKDQLEFYSIMFYGSDNSLPVYSAAYNFWEEEKDFDFSKHLIAQLDEKDNNFIINGDSEAIKDLKVFKDINFEEIDFYVFYVSYLSKKENQDKKVLVGFNGIDGKEVTMSKLKDDINEIRDSRSIYGREVEK